MRVVLKHAEIGLYYAGRKHWVGNSDSALSWWLTTTPPANSSFHSGARGTRKTRLGAMPLKCPVVGVH